MKSKTFVILLILALAVEAMAMDLNGTWYTGSKNGTPYLSASTDNYFTWGDTSTAGTASKGCLWSYFPDVTLSKPGDKITLEFSAEVNNSIVDGSRTFRFGLFNDGGTRLLENMDGDNTNVAFNDTTGYFTRWSIMPEDNSSIYGRTTGTVLPVSTSNAFAMAYSYSGNPGMTQGVANHFTFSILYVSENEYLVTSTQDNGTASTTMTGTRTLTEDDAATFNMICMLNPPTGIESMTFSGVKVFHNHWASNPYPAPGAVDVELDPILSWSTGMDPNDPTIENANINSHKLYGNFADPTDPNLFLITTLPVGTTTYDVTTLLPQGLQLDGAYQWRVDEMLGTDPDDPCIPGMVWSFDTILSTPGIDEQPGDLVVAEGAEAVLTVLATNPFTGDATGLSYQWKYSVDGVTYADVSGGNSAALILDPAQISDQGYYYCDVTLDSNNEMISSEIAQLIVKQTLAHWTMDQEDFISGQYVDIAGAHNADVPETPVFVAGAGPDMPAAGAAVIDPNSSGTVGSWNPLETTGQVTLSAWIKWDGTSLGSYGKDILSKQDSWGADTMMWSFKIRGVAANGNAGIWFYNKNDYGIRQSGLVPADTWTHVCVAYGSGQSSLYINGELTATDGSAALSNGTESMMRIGGGAAFPGAFDNVMIHNYAMDTDDVATLYYQTSQEAVCLYPPATDLNGDCKTDLQDIALLAEIWAECGLVPDCL